MLNIGRLSPDAAEYYIGEVASSAEDYYTGRGESEGRWVGSLAPTLGLEGAVAPDDFRAVLDGRDPTTGERLVRSRTGRQALAKLAPANQPGLFDGDALDGPRVAARLGVTTARVRQLLWAGRRASNPENPPKRYLIGTKVARAGTGGEQWLVARSEVERYEAVHRASKARPGYDLTLRPPKSVSILWALGSDEQRAEIRLAHREAVDKVVEYVERHALYARRGNGDRGKVETDGLVAAAFDHRTSRAGDPLLHTHVVTANLTRTADGNWQAIDGRPLFDQARPAGFLYQAHLRHLLSERLGIRWEPVHNGWAEVEGVPEAVIRLFSKRRDEIEEMVAEAGYSSARAQQLATLATRKAKEYGVDAETIERRWRAEAQALGFGRDQLEACFGNPQEPTSVDVDRVLAQLAGPEGLTKQASTFGRKEVVEALCEVLGAADAHTIDALADQFISSDLVTVLADRPKHVEHVHRRGGDRRRSADLARYTTPELLGLEQQLLDWANEGFGHAACTGAAPGAVERAIAARPSLSDEQTKMIRAVCADRAPQVQLVAGRPGSGKTFATAACVEALVSSGVPVVGCALSATAAAELEAATNLHVLTGQPAQTIARTLLDLRRHGLPNGVVLIVDEASMVGTRDLAELLRHVGSAGGSVKLIGDPDQHGPVEAGGFFNALCTEHEAEVVGLVANNRQLDAVDRAAIEEFRQGLVPAALARFEESGRIVKAPTAAASLSRMIDDWWSSVSDGSGDPMIAGPNRIRSQLNALARRRFRTEGRLGDETLVVGRKEFAVGDWVVTKRNERRLRSSSGDFVKNGSAGVVVSIERDSGSLVVGFKNEGRIELPASYLDDRTIDYGYARTTYGVQGATLERALYYANDQSSFEEGYVALTRGRREARIYIVDGTVVHDAESAHRGHDLQPTGLDTITEAMERRRANHLALEDDGVAADVVNEFAGWSLRELADERRRLHRALSDAPADVSRALANTSRQLDALATRRNALEQIRTDADINSGGRRHEREIESLEVAIGRTSERVQALREQWAERRAYLEAHRDEVERLRLAAAAERALELKVRTYATHAPSPALLAALGDRPDNYAAAQVWRNAVEESSVYVARYAEHADGPAEETVDSVLGERPTGEAAWAWDRAAAALRANLQTEMPAAVTDEVQLD